MESSQIGTVHPLYEPIATYLQTKCISIAPPFPDVPAVERCLRVILSVGGVAGFKRKPNRRAGQNTQQYPLQYHQSAEEGVCVQGDFLTRHQVMEQMAQELFQSLQDLELEAHHSHAILGFMCTQKANEFAKRHISKIDKRLQSESSNSLLLTKDSIAAAYVLTMLMTWVRIMFTALNNDQWDAIAARIHQTGILLRIEDSNKRIVLEPYLAFFTAAVIFGEVNSFTFLFRALSLLFRTNFMSLTKGSQPSTEMALVIAYSKSLDQHPEPSENITSPPSKRPRSNSFHSSSCSDGTSSATEAELANWEDICDVEHDDVIQGSNSR
jgi:hypothetical protein